MSQLQNLSIDKGTDLKWEVDELKMTSDAVTQKYELAEKNNAEMEAELDGLQKTIESLKAETKEAEGRNMES